MMLVEGGGGCCGEGRMLKAFVVEVRMGVFYNIDISFFLGGEEVEECKLISYTRMVYLW